MSCIIEFNESLLRLNFNCNNDDQKLLLDVLLKHRHLDIEKLAFILDSSALELEAIRANDYILEGERADTLSQIFLTFFGGKFFKDFTLIRRFA